MCECVSRCECAWPCECASVHAREWEPCAWVACDCECVSGRARAWLCMCTRVCERVHRHTYVARSRPRGRGDSAEAPRLLNSGSACCDSIWEIMELEMSSFSFAGRLRAGLALGLGHWLTNAQPPRAAPARRAARPRGTAPLPAARSSPQLRPLLPGTRSVAPASLRKDGPGGLPPEPYGVPRRPGWNHTNPARPGRPRESGGGGRGPPGGWDLPAWVGAASGARGVGSPLLALTPSQVTFGQTSPTSAKPDSQGPEHAGHGDTPESLPLSLFQVFLFVTPLVPSSPQQNEAADGEGS